MRGAKLICHYLGTSHLELRTYYYVEIVLMPTSRRSLLNGLIKLSPLVFPLYFFRFQLAGIPFTLLELFTYLLFAVFLFSVLSRKIKLKFNRLTLVFYLAVFALLIGSSLGVYFSPSEIPLPSGELQNSKMVALGIWKGWVVAPMLYFLVLTQSLSHDKTDKLLRMYVYSGGLVALVSYVFALMGPGLTHDFRLSGFFESANYLSLYIVPAFLLSLYFLVIGCEEKYDRYLNAGAFAILLHALILTQSYAAILGVFGAVALAMLVVFLKRFKSIKKLFLAILALMAVLALMVVSQLNSPKFKQFLDWENRSSTSVRLEVYDISYNLIKENPIWGVGPGLFQSFYQTKGPEILEGPPMEWNIPHAHNIFLAFWLNAGLIGFLAFIVLLVLAHKKLTYPIIGFWGLLIHGQFDVPFWKNDLAMVFWLILAAILILQNHATDPTQNTTGPLRKRATIRVSSSARAKRI